MADVYCVHPTIIVDITKMAECQVCSAMWNAGGEPPKVLIGRTEEQKP